MKKVKEDARRRAEYQQQERMAQERAALEGEHNYETFNKELEMDFEILIREGAEEGEAERGAKDGWNETTAKVTYCIYIHN